MSPGLNFQLPSLISTWALPAPTLPPVAFWLMVLRHTISLPTLLDPSLLSLFTQPGSKNLLVSLPECLWLSAPLSYCLSLGLGWQCHIFVVSDLFFFGFPKFLSTLPQHGFTKIWSYSTSWKSSNAIDKLLTMIFQTPHNLTRDYISSLSFLSESLIPYTPATLPFILLIPSSSMPPPYAFVPCLAYSSSLSAYWDSI